MLLPPWYYAVAYTTSTDIKKYLRKIDMSGDMRFANVPCDPLALHLAMPNRFIPPRVLYTDLRRKNRLCKARIQPTGGSGGLRSKAPTVSSRNSLLIPIDVTR
jgi:hypothetical protein